MDLGLMDIDLMDINLMDRGLMDLDLMDRGLMDLDLMYLIDMVYIDQDLDLDLYPREVKITKQYSLTN